MKRKVLILSPLSDQALAVARYLERFGKGRWELYAGFMEGEVFRATGPYKEGLRVDDLSQLDSYDVVLPTGAVSTYWMAKNYGVFKVNGIRYSTANLQCFDKINMLTRVEELCVPIPKTYSSISEIDDNMFPIFYKQKFERGGGARGIARSREELERLRPQSDLFYQEYIPGRVTYGMGFIAKDGRLLTFFQHEECLSSPVQGGSAVIIKTFYDDRLKAYTEKIVHALGLDGWGLAEFKYCPRRRDFVFMEINAKLWASIEFAFMNNKNFMRYMFEIDYPEEKCDRVVFVDRLISLGLKEVIRNSRYVLNSQIISYRPAPKLLLHLIAGILPSSCRQVMKRVMCSTGTL